MAKLRVGLTGGIGSGKSAVAAVFLERGATVIDADVLAREVVAPGSDGLREIAARWPQAIGPDGALDRPALARIVFGASTSGSESEGSAALAELNAITHPRVRERADALEREAPAGIVVHVVPLLFEGDFWRRCDRTVLVAAPDEVRIARVVARDATERAAVERRMAAQIDPELARIRAGYVVENDGDLEQLRERTLGVFENLVRDLAAKETSG
ncbi:MAG TPA: dephospho-CoA kinase [Candidatus Elarobacter sp.]|jgi:dephospho-CoA kinase|nr:dephospho-CoA kinase [Candidatus Elarobacter sp.]